MTSFPTTATAWVEALARDEFSATEGVEHVLFKIEQLNPEINAFIKIFASNARKRARELDDLPASERGRLHGLPIALKDELDIQGIPTGYGTSAATTSAKQDSEVVRRLKEAGAIIIGTTTMPEFGAFPITSTASFGVTRNPLNYAYSPGGSSGGTAAAVVAGMVPAAIGSDGGGSIRIPSAYTGLIGLKPSRDRVPGASWGKLGTTGPLTLTTKDADLIYSVISPTFEDLSDHVPDNPRFTVFTSSPSPLLPTHRDNVRAVETAAHRLKDFGTVTDTSTRLPDPTFVFTPHYWHEVGKSAKAMDQPRRLEKRIRTISRFGTIAKKLGLLRSFGRLTQTVDKLFEDADFLVTPATAGRAPRADKLVGKNAISSMLIAMPGVAFTAIFNVTGHPAISIPWGKGKDGLPSAIQIVGKPGSERQLLSLAKELLS